MTRDDKIIIRALEPEDLEHFYKWENDMDLWDVSDTVTPFSHYVLKQYIESCAHLDIYTSKQVRLMIEDAQNKEPVGLIDLYDFDPYHQRAGLGIMIHDFANRKKGYASSAVKLMLDYCFEVLGLHQVYTSVPNCNIASKKLFEKLGFMQTGYRKEWLKRGDDWEDVIYFQILANDWKYADEKEDDKQ